MAAAAAATAPPTAVSVAPVAPVAPVASSHVSNFRMPETDVPRFLRKTHESTQVFYEFVEAMLPVLRAPEVAEESRRAFEPVHPTDQADNEARLRGLVVLIEPREHACTEFVLRMAADALRGAHWGLVIVHGSTNGAFMRKVTLGPADAAAADAAAADGAADEEEDDVVPMRCAHAPLFIELGKANLTIPEYNDLLTTPEFWTALPHNRLLIIQTDVVLLTGRGLGGVDPATGAPDTRFLDANVDYLGAPWWNVDPFTGVVYDGRPDQPELSGGVGDQTTVASLAPHCVGNGGFSLRTKEAALEALALYVRKCSTDRMTDLERSLDLREPIDCFNEDVFFAAALQRLPHRTVGARDLAQYFSTECVPPSTIHVRDRAATTGVHKMWNFQGPAITRAILWSADRARAVEASKSASAAADADADRDRDRDPFALDLP